MENIMTQSTIITFHTWSQSMSHVQWIDIESSEFLAESVSGFMDSPVGIHQGKTITAKSRKIDARSIISNQGYGH